MHSRSAVPMSTNHTMEYEVAERHEGDRSITVWSDRLLVLVDLCLACIIFIAPLCMGGRHPFGRLVLVATVGVLGVAWMARQCVARRASWVFSGAEWLLLGGVVLVLVQLLPLPLSLIKSLSPATLDLLPLWTGEGAIQLGPWNQLSLSPIATRGGLVLYTAYALLFLVVVQRVRTVNDVERLLKWIALSAIGMAMFALCQLLLSNGKFFWFFSHPTHDTFQTAKGAFVNQNHFAHFLALGMGPLLWWLRRLYLREKRSLRAKGNVRAKGTRGRVRRGSDFSAPRRRGGLTKMTGSFGDAQTGRLWLAIGLGILLTAGLLSFSRGGVIALGIAGTLTLVLFISTRLLPKRSLVLLAVIATVVGAALLIHGYEPLARKLRTLSDARSLTDVAPGRVNLWKADRAAAARFPLCGTGVGTHREVYPTYMPEYYDVEFTHAENGFLQLAVETGGFGVICMLLGIGLSMTWCLSILVRHGTDTRYRRHVACTVVVLTTIVVSVVHSLGDFVWYIPACMSLVVILIGCVCRIRQIIRDVETSNAPRGVQPAFRERWWMRLFGPAGVACPPRSIWVTATIVLLFLCIGMLRDCLPSARGAGHWNQFLQVSLNSDSYLLNDEQAEEKLGRMYHHLQGTLDADPGFARANLRMAAVYLRSFELAQRNAENPMSLSQIRDAALASRFPTRQAQDAWLNVAVGENRKLLDRALYHCWRALQLCPMQGEGYIYLADLHFLVTPKSGVTEALVAQAEKVRPHDGKVQFAVGREAALAGDIFGALKYWKRAFDRDPEVRSTIIEMFAVQTPADCFLPAFEPNTEGLSQLFRHYRELNRDEDARVVAVQYVQALEENAPPAGTVVAANHWHEAQVAYSFLGEHDKAIECAQREVTADSTSIGRRLNLAKLLFASERFDDAAEQFQWCLRRKPDDLSISQQLADTKRRIALRQSGSFPPNRSPSRDTPLSRRL